jgi:PIN domain nuclease of toxin-antitoxin system
VYLSSGSPWEIAVKHSPGRLPLPAPPIDFVPAQREAHGIELLPLSEEEALYISRLPNLHRDPFDRMLICQAVVNGFAVLTPDLSISQYALVFLRLRSTQARMPVPRLVFDEIA